MKQISYTSLVGSLIYAQICNIAYAVSSLAWFNQFYGWITGEPLKLIRYLHRSKDFMLICSSSDDLEIVGYIDLRVMT